MSLGLSKAYTPVTKDVADPSAYNTDIAALFNAFSGLEAQSSTLGGLTITGTADSTTKFKVTNSAATELFSLDTTNLAVKVRATSRLYLDGGGDTYLYEKSANVVDIVVGNAIAVSFDGSQNVVMAAAGKLFLDGGNNTYIYEKTADVVDIVVGGAIAVSFDGSQNVVMAEGGDLFFDGGTDTYITSPSADILDIYVGAANVIKITEAATEKVEILAAALEIDATQNFYLDGGGDTYLTESGADVLDIYVGGANIVKITETSQNRIRLADTYLDMEINDRMYFDIDGTTPTVWIEATGEDVLTLNAAGVVGLTLNSTTGGTGGAGSAGAGNQYVELMINGNRYKLLHDGTV